MREIESKVFSHLSFNDKKLTKVADVAASESLFVNSYDELVKKMALIFYHNKDHLLFYRGQSEDYKNRNGNSSFYPTIYRTKPNENLSPTELEYSFKYLEKASTKLVEIFEQNHIESIKEVKMRKYIQWSILQHYEVCHTPLLDLTQSIRVACSFALNKNQSKYGYVFVFGLPYITNRISINSEHDLVNIRLINICPPEALRPYFQEGILVCTNDVTTDYENRNVFDFKRRLIAKFKIPNNDDFWGIEHSMVKSLKPENDSIDELCKQITVELKKSVSAESIFPGVWLDEFWFPDERHDSERIQIKDENKYYANGKLLFKVDLVERDDEKQTIRFRKVGFGKDKRQAINDLKIIDDRTYEGLESKDIKVKYTRID